VTTALEGYKLDRAVHSRYANARYAYGMKKRTRGTKPTECVLTEDGSSKTGTIVEVVNGFSYRSAIVPL
jgi:thermostable 8-oxoguanine DNA glycosylase